MEISGKEYYEKHKNTSCHINGKKYFKNLADINLFLSKLKKLNKKPVDEDFKRTFRLLLKAKPTGADPQEWTRWKNKVLERLSIIANVPDDLCEATGRDESPKKSSSCAAKRELPFPLEHPPSLLTSNTLVGDDESDSLPLGFSQDVYAWKEILTPITEQLDHELSKMLEAITSDKEVEPYLVVCESAQTYPVTAAGAGAGANPVYTYFLTGGAAYRGLARYLRAQLPSLPALEEIAPKSHDYDINFYANDIAALPATHLFERLRSFCHTLLADYKAVFTKVHTLNGIHYEFIKPSPCIERKGTFDHEYEYIDDLFLLSSVLFYKSANNPVSLSFQITLCLQITTATETYCSTDHILDISFSKEESGSTTAQLAIHEHSWYPLIDIQSVLFHIANQQRIACIPNIQTEMIQRFQVEGTTYQIPNVLTLCLLSIHGMVNRGVLEEVRFYKARQDYARMYAILRMLATFPKEIVLEKTDIAYLYTLLKSITVIPHWATIPIQKKKEMIKLYKDAIHDKAVLASMSLKTAHTARLYDRSAKEYKTVELWTYYNAPYEEFRTHPKEEDPLLWELGQAKFALRRAIIDEKIEKDRAKARKRSCDGTTRRSAARSSRKTQKRRRYRS